MKMNCANREMAVARRTHLQRELASVGTAMEKLSEAIATETATLEEETRADALMSRADEMQAELKELEDKWFKGTRKTGPSTPGSRAGSPVKERSTMTTAYQKLHCLDGELDDGGFKSLGEFLSVLGSGRFDDRILAMRAAASGSMSGTGGVMVPERFVAEMLHPPGEGELVMPRASSFAMNEGTLHVSTLDNLSNADGEMYGGFTSQWIAEGGEFSEQTPKTSKITLNRKKLGIFTVASNELVSDSQYEAQLIPALQSAIQEFRDYAFFRGDGAGKPKGILEDVAIVTVAKETGQAADTIVAANLDKMYARLHPRLVRNAAWFVNPTAIPQLLKLVREVGTGGQTIPVLNEANGSFSMYGLPVNLTAKLPVVGDSGDILLADVSQYAVGFGRGLVIDRSDHAKFQTDQVCWRAVWRGDGQGRWRAPFTPRNGDTLSWCVKLAERA